MILSSIVIRARPALLRNIPHALFWIKSLVFLGTQINKVNVSKESQSILEEAGVKNGTSLRGALCAAFYRLMVNIGLLIMNLQ